MEFFKSNTVIPFMRQRKIAAVFSAIIFVVSMWSLFMNGLNLGLEFTGGTQIDVTLPSGQHSTGSLATHLRRVGFKHAEVQQYAGNDISIRVATNPAYTQEELRSKIQGMLPKGAEITAMSFMGPQVSETLKWNGILAVVVGLLGTIVYISLRFEWRFALSAAIALIHDPVLILGVFSYFHIEFDMIALVAVLTVIGYSLNDTIVVFDRVRENFRKIRKGTASEIMDTSINQTLSRTIMTSGLTLLVVIALFLYGGAPVHGFSLALIIGIVIGTYSSIYVAGALAIIFGLDRQSLVPAAKKALDDLP